MTRKPSTLMNPIALTWPWMPQIWKLLPRGKSSLQWPILDVSATTSRDCLPSVVAYVSEIPQMRVVDGVLHRDLTILMLYDTIWSEFTIGIVTSVFWLAAELQDWAANLADQMVSADESSLLPCFSNPSWTSAKAWNSRLTLYLTWESLNGESESRAYRSDWLGHLTSPLKPLPTIVKETMSSSLVHGTI